MKSAGSRLLACTLLTGAALLMTPAVASADDGHTTTCTADARIAGAQTYVAALADPSFAHDVPVADNVIRFENGLQTGFSGPFMKAELAAHLQYGGITGIDNATWSQHGNLVRTVYDLDYGFAGIDVAGATVDETFAFDDHCLITRIDATITVRLA
jgi:hypothetical protein